MNFLGIVFSILFIFLIIGLSSYLTKKKILSGENSRKFIHIGVSNWWIIAMIFFDSYIYASIVPAIFIVVNYISYKKNIFKSMERDGNIKDLGTVYYAISLLILSIITFRMNSPEIGAMGILVMGYGDGFAALIGEKYGNLKIKFNKNKSILGSITMFIVSFIVALIISNIYGSSNVIIISFTIAFIATIVELISPIGTDNLTVPLIVSIIYYFF